MKPSRHNKLLGVALGEKSLMAAEVVAGQRPQVKRLAEMVYPDGVSLQQPVELGKALNEFLREKGFSVRTAVIGIPVKWLVVRPKDVPQSDPRTLASLLRLQAESEFSSELKDLVYDYTDGQTVGATKTVLLMATSRKHLDDVTEMCDAAKVKAVAIMPSALALGRSTGAALAGSKSSPKEVLVLAVNEGGSELTAQLGSASSAIRYLRPLDPRQAFISELRRTVSTLPGGSSGRELMVWDGAGVDAKALGEQVGLTVRSGDLPVLGIDTSLTGANGDGRKYAAAVTLAMSALTGADTTVDFLHSRLAPPKEQLIPRWVVLAALAAIALIGGAIYGFTDLQNQQAIVDHAQATVDSDVPAVTIASKDVARVSTAQNWHGGKPQYLAAIRDITAGIPEDGVTYVTNLSIKEITHVSNGSQTNAAKEAEPLKLAGTIEGKTQSQQQWQMVLSALKNNPAMSDVVLISTSSLPRERMVAFTIEFKYDPSKAGL